MTKQLIRVVKLLVKVCIVLLHFYSFLEPALIAAEIFNFRSGGSVPLLITLLIF